MVDSRHQEDEEDMGKMKMQVFVREMFHTRDIPSNWDLNCRLLGQAFLSIVFFALAEPFHPYLSDLRSLSC